MDSELATCPDCRTAYDPTDNYCRQCGMFVAALRTLAPAPAHSQRALEPIRPGLPAPMKKAATAIAIGTALQIGVGLAGKYLAAQAGKQALATAAAQSKPAKRQSRDKRAVAESPMPAEAAAVSETLIIRRVWIRRPQ